MKKNLIFVLLIFSNYSYAQKDSTVILKKNAVYTQLMGLGGITINYDRVFIQKPNWKLAYRLGLETVTFLQKNDSRVVGNTELNFLVGKQKHFFETGIGVNANWPQVRRPVAMIFTYNIGYRYQQRNGGFFFRGNLYPALLYYYPSNTYEKTSSAFSWWRFGISLGKSF